MLRFNILDDDFIGDEFIAQYTIPFNCVRTGLYFVVIHVDCYFLEE